MAVTNYHGKLNTDGEAYQAARLIADELAADNPRFDREHFLAVVRGERDLNSRPGRKHIGRDATPQEITDALDSRPARKAG